MQKQPAQAGIIATIGLLFSMSSGMTLAGPLIVPDIDVKSPKSPAAASQVNKAFEAVEDAVNDNDARITANEAQIDFNTTDIDTNILAIDNIDAAIADLQTGKRPAGRRTVTVDCTDNADALKAPPIADSFNPYTTFEISGACNGPIFLASDGVHIVGVDENRAASIVLPAAEEVEAVFVDGGHDVRLENLTIDAGTGPGGVAVRNAFVRLINVDVVGGRIGVTPFRNAIVRTSGEINITGFIDEGISVGDTSVFRSDGQVKVSTLETQGSLIAVDAFRGGSMDFRRGLVVSVPPGRSAVEAGNFGSIRIRNRGTVSITGNVVVYRTGIFDMRAGSVLGDIDASSNSRVQLAGVTQSGGVNFVGSNSHFTAASSMLQQLILVENSTAGIFGGSTVSGDILVERGSSISMSQSTQNFGNGFTLRQNATGLVNDASIGALGLDMLSSLSMFNTTFEGGFANRGSALDIGDSFMLQGLFVNSSYLNYFGGNLNGNILENCNAIESNIGLAVAGTGNVTCP